MALHTLNRRTTIGVTVAGAAIAAIAILSAEPLVSNQQPPPAGQQQTQPAGRQGGGRQGGGGGRGGAPIPYEDHTGYQQIFDGVSLKGWDGDPAFWKVEDGAIVGQSTAENAVKQNTFIIWRGGEPADFDLKVEFRMNSTNSGVQYRSVQLPASADIGKWVLKGYQADIDFDNNYTGMLYEERGRMFLAPRGTFGFLGPAAEGATQQRGSLGAIEATDALKALVKVNDWNQFHVIARGNVLIHVLNGHVTALFVDDDAANRAMKGLIGFQIHVGPPMKVEFKNIWLKKLS